MAHLLIVDDEQSICWGLSKLAASLGHTADAAASAEEALELFARRRADAVILDIRLPGMDGLAAIDRFRQSDAEVPIVLITAHGDLATAVAAVRKGAFDYLLKPFELKVARRAIERMLAGRPQPLPPPRTEAAEQIVGCSPAIQEVFKRIALVAASDACVHLFGESGTGKELVAAAIHRYSARAAGPFVAVNVAALSPTLAESELFGHARGAFTGAEQARTGLLEQAHGGTIFLDEVADIPLALQVKLLRALEHGEVLPVGASRAIRCDFRVISATHQDLARRVAQRRFRHDLYYRLLTFEIAIPPLRQRPQDIEPLVAHFLRQLAARGGQETAAVSAEALAELRQRPWHGNVRELRNAVEHAVILAQGGAIAPEHLPPPLAPLDGEAAPEAIEAGGEPSALAAQIDALVRRWTEARLDADDPASPLYAEFLRLVEEPLLQTALARHGGQYAAAARRLGLHRTTLRKKLGTAEPTEGI